MGCYTGATWYKPVVPGAGGDPCRLLPGTQSNGKVISARRDECRLQALVSEMHHHPPERFKPVFHRRSSAPSTCVTGIRKPQLNSTLLSTCSRSPNASRAVRSLTDDAPYRWRAVLVRQRYGSELPLGLRPNDRQAGGGMDVKFGPAHLVDDRDFPPCKAIETELVAALRLAF